MTGGSPPLRRSGTRRTWLAPPRQERLGSQTGRPDASARGLLRSPSPGKTPTPGQGAGRLAVLTGAGVQRFGPDQERRTDGVKRKFLEVIAGLLGEDLVDHEGLVAPPACLGAPGRGQPGLRLGLGLAVHCGAARRPRGWGAAGGCQTRGRSRMGRPAPPSAATPPPGSYRRRRSVVLSCPLRFAPLPPCARRRRAPPLYKPSDKHLSTAFLGRSGCQSGSPLLPAEHHCYPAPGWEDPADPLPSLLSILRYWGVCLFLSSSPPPPFFFLVRFQFGAGLSLFFFFILPSPFFFLPPL